MRAALYLRVSTDDGGRQTVENQQLALTEFAHRKGWRVVATYAERVSGAASMSKRRELLKMFDDAAAGKFDLLVCFSISRLTRNGAGDALVIVERLHDLGVDVVSSTEEFINTAGPFGPMFISTFAKIEREQLSERVRAGQARARSQGKICNRHRISTSAAAIADLRAKGMSLAQIAHRLGVSKHTIGRRLKEPTQQGELTA